jgi:hypothetical protein
MKKKKYTEKYDENDFSKNNKLSTSSRIARDSSLSPDKLDRRD